LLITFDLLLSDDADRADIAAIHAKMSLFSLASLINFAIAYFLNEFQPKTVFSWEKP
jgi:hypothetical protein